MFDFPRNQRWHCEACGAEGVHRADEYDDLIDECQQCRHRFGEAVKELTYEPDEITTSGTLTTRQAPAQPATVRPDAMSILAAAVERGQSPESLRELMALAKDMQAVQAEQAFHAAMAAFKAECPPVQRRTENTQFKATRDGRTVARKYASLEDIEHTIRGPLGKHGLSYRWSDTIIDKGMMTMRCVVAHSAGHKIESGVSIPVESRNNACNQQQQFGSAMTYAQRYSLIQALGLTSCDEDTDGEYDPETINEHQAANIDAMLDEFPADTRPKFLKWIGVDSVSAIPSARFAECVKALEAKRKERA